MNANAYDIDILVEAGQVEDAVKSIFHTILLHRTTGKFHYRKEGTYTAGIVGTEDVDCNFIDFTYVKVASEPLEKILSNHVNTFRDQLRLHRSKDCAVGTITLEFYQKHRSRWPFSDECVPWEMWNLQVTEQTMPCESGRVLARETAGAVLADKVASVVEAVGRHDFVPKMPTHTDLSLVFETNLPDVQPYLFKIRYNLGDIGFAGSPNGVTTTLSSTVRRLFRDTWSVFCCKKCKHHAWLP